MPFLAALPALIGGLSGAGAAGTAGASAATMAGLAGTSAAGGILGGSIMDALEKNKRKMIRGPGELNIPQQAEAPAPVEVPMPQASQGLLPYTSAPPAFFTNREEDEY